MILSLFFLQIRQGTRFGSLGKKQYALHITQYPERAEIYDRNGHVLAHNKESVSAFILPQSLEKPDEVFAFLKKYFPLAADRLTSKKDTHFLYVKRRLSVAEQDRIQKSGLKDIKLLKEASRYYSVPEAGPVVGITNVDNRGLFGVEKMFEEQLAGSPTTFLLEKDARSSYFYFSKRSKQAGRQGRPISLTIDGDLQFLAYEEVKEAVEKFNAEMGAAVIVDPTTGHIITMVNYPCFDPEDTEHIDLDKTRNKIVSDVFEFGSVMKAFVSLAAFEKGVVTTDEIIDCENKESTLINGIKVNTIIPHDKIPFCDVVAGSNNIGMAKVAMRLGPELYNAYRKLGFGSFSDIGFLGEQKGTITHPSKWSKQSLFSLSYGYEISANLLQLARGFSIIARDGEDVKLKIIYENNNRQEGKRLYNKKAVKNLKDILRVTVQEGTAWRAKLEGYDIIGKTGSADLYTEKGYDKNRSIFTFAGIITKDDYQRVVIAFVKNVSRKRLYSASVTAPLFRNIIEKMLIHDKEI